MNLEDAYQVIEELGEKDNLSEFEYELLTGATNALDNFRRNRLREQINKIDIQKMFPIYKQLRNMDVESHEDVIQAQKIMKEHGYYAGELDSLYGPATKTARGEIEEDIMYHPQFLVHSIVEQAKGLFNNWNK